MSITADGTSSQRAIFVVGPSSCGKTTLCDALAEDLQLAPELYIQERARIVMKTQGFTRDDIPTYEMQNAIMISQLQAEKDASRHSDPRSSVLFLSDRSAIDPVIYAATSGSEGAEDMSTRLRRAPSLQEHIPFYRRSLFGVFGMFSLRIMHAHNNDSCPTSCTGMVGRRRNPVIERPNKFQHTSL